MNLVYFLTSFFYPFCPSADTFFFVLLGNENKVTLTREVSLIRERLRAIEAESGFLKHAAMTLQRDGEGTKLLTEIAEHLRRLRQSIDSPSKDANA